MLFALKYPDMVDKLILNGGNTNTRGVKALVQISTVLGYAIASIIAVFDKKAVTKKEILSLMVGQPDISAKELSGLKMPKLVLAGTNDMIKQSHTEAIASALGNAKLVILEGDHYIASKNSDEFNLTVDEFLKEQ